MEHLKTNQFPQKPIRTTLIAAAALTLAACGGDGNGGGGGGTSNRGTEVTLEEFRELAIQAGLWRFDAEIEFEGEFEVENQTFDFMTDLDTVSVSTVVLNDDDSITYDSCDLEGEQTTTREEVIDDEPIQDDTYEDFCELEMTYYQVSDTKFNMIQTCDGDEFSVATIELLSSQPEFDNGSFSFDLEGFDSLNASDGVCGSKYNVNSSVEGALEGDIFVEDDESSEFKIVAPYTGDSRVVMRVDSYGEELGVGTYNIGIVDSVVMLTVESEVFGAPGAPQTLTAISGEVTFTEYSQYRAAGSFDVNVADGSRFNGSFELDLD